MATYQTMTFLRSPKELIQAETYERIVLEFMTESRTIFPEKYFHVEEQSHGEPDFISISGIRYDAKQLFSTEQCKFLEKGDEELIHWMKSVREELGQASRILMNGNLRDIHNTRLYGEMLRRLPKESIIENTIYFNITIADLTKKNQKPEYKNYEAIIEELTTLVGFQNVLTAVLEEISKLTYLLGKRDHYFFRRPQNPCRSIQGHGFVD